LHELVCVHTARTKEKKDFVLHELDEKLVRNLYRTYQLQTLKKRNIFYCANWQKKIFLLHELDKKHISDSYCSYYSETLNKRSCVHIARTEKKIVLHELDKILVRNLYRKY